MPDQPATAASVGMAPLRESMEFAPGHFWTYSETPYESTIRCQCKWGWRWNQPWGGRDMALATYRDHARNETGWKPIEHGVMTWQGSSM